MAQVDILRDRPSSGFLCQMMVCDIERGDDDETIVKARFVDWAPALEPGEIVLVGERGESIVIAIPPNVAESKNQQFLVDAVYPVLRIGE